jgi:transposase-like protein
MVKNLFYENQNERNETTGTVHTGFKLEALRLVKCAQVATVTAKILGIPRQTRENWMRLANKVQLKGAGNKPVSPEQM